MDKDGNIENKIKKGIKQGKDAISDLKETFQGHEDEVLTEQVKQNLRGFQQHFANIMLNYEDKEGELAALMVGMADHVFDCMADHYKKTFQEEKKQKP